MDHLRSKRCMRRSRHASEQGHSRVHIVDAISTHERPAEAEGRAIPGRREGDLLAGGKNSYVATLVERHSRFLMLVKVPSKETEAVVAALSEYARKLPATPRLYLTWHRGLEMAKHKEFTVATDVLVYQSAAAAILPARNGPSCPHSSAARPGLTALESTPKKHHRIPSKCCVDHLSRHDLPGLEPCL